jgi:hypothetical protein
MYMHRRSKLYVVIIIQMSDGFVVIVWVLAAILGTLGDGVSIPKTLWGDGPVGRKILYS